MPKVSTKKKNNAGQPFNCQRCSEKIVAGEEYYEWAFFRQRTPNRQHKSHGYPKGSQLTQSKMSEAHAAAEEVEDALETYSTPTELSEALGECIDRVRDVAAEYEEAIQNMPASEEQNQERIDQLENFVSDLETAQGEIESLNFNLVDEDDTDLSEDDEAANEEAMVTARDIASTALSNREF